MYPHLHYVQYSDSFDALHSTSKKTFLALAFIGFVICQTNVLELNISSALVLIRNDNFRIPTVLAVSILCMYCGKRVDIDDSTSTVGLYTNNTFEDEFEDLDDYDEDDEY